MQDALGDYLRNIGRIPLLTAAEEVHLASLVQEWLVQTEPSRAVERRGRRAMHRMVCANLRLVVMICMRRNRHIIHLQVDVLDLVQAGNLGLMRAVERFDPSRGYRFSTYGYWWIRQVVNRYLRKRTQTIKVPADINDLAKRATAIRAANSAPLTKQNVAQALGESEERIDFVLEVSHRCNLLSLDQRIGGDDNESNLIDVISDGQSLNPVDDYGWLHDKINLLNPQERRVIQLRYNRDQSLSMAKVAEATGLKKGQVQWIEKQALLKLRRQIAPMLSPE
jgi:RNA polymerase sigma factor (sigma-70 family)